MTLDLIIEDDRWEALGLEALGAQAAEATFDHLKIAHEGYEIALLACDDGRIATLNADFRGKPQPTNVLSWPEADLSPDDAGDRPWPPEHGDPEDPHHLGDIALAYETCVREAQEQNKPTPAHVTHLLVHGVLHLLGYDHIRDGDATLMERLEVEILNNLGLPDPYKD